MDFGKRLKTQRNLHGLRQQDLAAIMNVSRTTIAGYECGKRQPDYTQLICIAQYFQICVDYLLGNEKQNCKACKYEVIPLNDLSLASQKKLCDFKQLLLKAERD